MNGPRILLVEASASSSPHTAAELRARGYEVIEAPSGEAAEALAAARGEELDLVLMDLSPGEITERFRAAEAVAALRDLPFVFLAARFDEETAARAERFGACGFAAKDGSIGFIDASIRTALRLHKARTDISGRFIEIEGKRYVLSVVEEVSDRRIAQRALERLARIESFVSKTTQLMLREADERALLEGACRIAVEEGGFDKAWIGLVGEDGDSLRSSARANLEAGEIEDIVARISAPEARGGLSVRAALARRPVVILDIERDEEAGPWRESCLASGCRSAAAFPLIAGTRLLGVYSVFSGQPELFSEAETRLLEQFATDIAFALDLHRVEREKEEAELKAREGDLLYRESFKQSSAVKLLVDPSDGRIVDANLAASEFYGYPVEALRAMRVMDLNTLAPDRVRENMDRIRSGRADRFEVRHRLASGEERDVEVFSGPIRIGGKELLHSIIHDVTEKKRAEESLERMVAEKVTLMKELQHRVKNNLNVVVGLLSLEEGRCRDEEAREALSAAIARVGSIASVYEKLYSSEDLASIDIGPYAEELASSLFATYNLDPARVSLKTDFDSLRLDTKRCVPFGLVLNELVSNALKYAYPGEASGEVRVELRMKEGRVSLLVADDGQGVPDRFRGEDADSMGMTLVRMLAVQLGGSFELDCGPRDAPGGRGTRAILRFPA